MKRSIVLAALFAACSKPAAPPPAAATPPPPPADSLPAVTEVEPNDTPDRAQPIDGPARVGGDLHAVQPASHPDEDWYRVQPRSMPQDLRVELSALPSGRVAFEVYDKDRNKLLSVSSDGPAQGCVLPSFRVRDPIYLRVFSPGGAVGHYSLALRLSAPDPDAEAEPNDRAIDATPLPGDHPMHGTIGTPADQDWYRVDLVAPSDGGTAPVAGAVDAGTADAGTPQDPAALARLQISAVPNVRLEVHLFDQDQRPLGALEGRTGEAIDVRDLGLFAGVRSVYVVVQSGYVHGKRVAAPETPYTIAFHAEPAPPNFEIEPNDTVDQATPIANRRYGYLSPQGDVDYYVLHVGTPSLLHARLGPLDHVDTELSVVDRPARPRERDAVLLRANEAGPKEAEVIPSVALPAGDHFVKVEAAAHQVGAHWVRDQENPTDPYELDVSLVPDDGSFEREPNDRPAQATAIKLGQTLRGYAYPARDVDFYRLDLSAQPVGLGVAVKLTGVAKVALALQLRGPLPAGEARTEGPLINTSDHGKAGSPESVRAKLDPGVYLVVVRPDPALRVPGQPGGDPDDAYSLSVQAE